ncbi:hypothetical protein N181_25245 [Sinorhizobium fredii USDA 205]|uniref:Uncharacterized protein n=2 Tax=Sinorhizobium TaxID=28105 RepID=A0A844ADX5_RHIFR|nr:MULTISPECIES: hypothetical protein [Sinorhizobium]KSV83684.1 hypothetical protein N181_25245 [Sinorhizobium fredii USDA 205]MQX10737.1 hypothetical protein [Sinorhizobium fredii]OAP40353.1 hypothetical protein AU381_00040 [Sinorhizobium glycinis]GEC33565.1 hypothetical protein EFR01_37360 [Sinorhizobium fredii]GLS11866.1 hypothetical protein GCM10007864_54980 [Sinorhizobium fredii]
MTAALRLRMLPRFPARIEGTDGVKVERASGSPDLTVSLDFENLGDIATIPDPEQNYFAMYDASTGAYHRILLQSMIDVAGVAFGYPTIAAAELANVPVAVHAIYVFGDATVGDGAGGLFIDSNNGSATTFVSGDGRTWYLAEDIGTDRLVSDNLKTLAGMTLGAAGLAILADAVQADVRDYLDIPPYVADRTALKALDTTKDTLAFNKEAGRQGIFQWTTGDHSTQITADTQEGVYIKADAIASTAGAWVRVGDPTVYHFGGSAGANSATAISVMAAVMGFVRFPTGATKLGANLTVDVPVYFQDAAYVTVDATFTLTITNRIESSRQWIFRGDGSISLAHDSDSGEDARMVHVSWFGAFPTPAVGGTDQGPLIQKACTAMGNLRESVIEFDVGNYYVDSGITVTRGCWIKGAGTRRTVFKVDADGFDVFTTDETACRFTGIQFELDTITTRANAWIRVAHSECYIEDIFWQSAALGIVVENGGTACRIKDVTGVYGADPGAGSSMIRVLGATGVTIDGVRIPTSSTLAPTAMVHAGGSGASAISGLSVENTSGVGPCLHVHLQASAANISHVIINGVRYNGFAGTAPAQVIKLETASTFSIDGVSISDFQINSHPTAGISLVQASSGVLENVTMSNGVIVGASGNGVEFIRTAGTLGSVRIDGTVDASERATPFSYSGTVSDIQISPQALPNVNSAFSYFFTIADDSVATIDLRRSVFSGAVHLTAGSARHGIFTIRAASTPTVSANRVTDANTVATAAVLTGTTGTDGNLTLGVQSGVLYIENRLGSSQSVSVTVMAA